MLFFGPRFPGKSDVATWFSVLLNGRPGGARPWARLEWGVLRLYGIAKLVCYKTFLGTYPPASGLIRVVIVRERDGSWRAYFCTNPHASVAEILEAVADRSAIEQNFHDLKEVHGVGEQHTVAPAFWASFKNGFFA